MSQNNFNSILAICKKRLETEQEKQVISLAKGVKIPQGDCCCGAKEVNLFDGLCIKCISRQSQESADLNGYFEPKYDGFGRY